MKHENQFTLTLTFKERLFGWIYLIFQLVALPFVITMVAYAFGIFSTGTLNLICYWLNAAACGLIFRRLMVQSARNLRGRTDEFLEAVILGFLIYYMGSGVVGLLNTFLWPDFANVNDAGILEMVSQAPVLMTLAVVVLVPFAEECLFRGLIFTPLARKNTVLAYAVTTLLFSACHVVGYIGVYAPEELAIALLQYLPTAALCWACRKADSLLAPMTVHALVNAVSLLTLR